MKQTLIVFQKADRKLIASFQPNGIITEMDALTIPGVGYEITTKNDLFYKKSNGEFYVKDND